jgi:uncharacterized protein YndB with AHSA1/START domain
MTMHDVAPLEATTEIDVPVERVWELVSDLRNTARWSPQCVRTFMRGETAVGRTALNLNRRGFLLWPTQSQVVRVVPEREIAFRVKENFTVWSYLLEDLGEGRTRLTNRREAPQGISGVSVRLTKVAFGGVPGFTEELQSGMEQTLAGIKAEAEAG